MNAQELAAKAQAAKPQYEYYYSADGVYVGAFIKEHGVVVAVASKTILDTWANVPGILLVNGVPMAQDAVWIKA